MQQNILEQIEKENLINNTRFVTLLYENSMKQSPEVQPDDLQKLANIAMLQKITNKQENHTTNWKKKLVLAPKKTKKPAQITPKKTK